MYIFTIKNIHQTAEYASNNILCMYVCMYVCINVCIYAFIRALDVQPSNYLKAQYFNILGILT